MLLTNQLLIITALCLIGTRSKPSFSFNLHPFAVFNGLGINHEERDAVKKYSGRRISNESLRQVYFHDQTIAVVELGPEKLLLNCEFIEVYKEDDAKRELRDLRQIAIPLHIEFKQMLDLMHGCAQVEANRKQHSGKPQTRSGVAKGFLTNNPFTLFSGIIPGTKWCGTGDIAETYYDLGPDEADRCCRAHDLCPVKIRANTKRYNITNASYYTKSHCECDQGLYDCLKRNNTPTSTLLGNVYFNLVRVPCVTETPTGHKKIISVKHPF